jgi:predicted enzyme related to lactoylglutathione lyase
MSGDGFRYATLKINGTEVGGIGELGSNMPTEVPAHWQTYFATADTDASVAAATAAGGQVIQPPQDSPYGRMATVADDQGATFSLISVSPPS